MRRLDDEQRVGVERAAGVRAAVRVRAGAAVGVRVRRSPRRPRRRRRSACTRLRRRRPPTGPARGSLIVESRQRIDPRAGVERVQDAAAVRAEARSCSGRRARSRPAGPCRRSARSGVTSKRRQMRRPVGRVERERGRVGRAVDAAVAYGEAVRAGVRGIEEAPPRSRVRSRGRARRRCSSCPGRTRRRRRRPGSP